MPAGTIFTFAPRIRDLITPKLQGKQGTIIAQAHPGYECLFADFPIAVIVDISEMAEVIYPGEASE